MRKLDIKSVCFEVIVRNCYSVIQCRKIPGIFLFSILNRSLFFKKSHASDISSKSLKSLKSVLKLNLSEVSGVF